MKALCITLAVILILCAAGAGFYYLFPVTILKNVDPQEVGSIAVFNGSTGARFTVAHEGEIFTIVDNLQGVSVKRNGISSSTDGFAYSLTVMDKKGRTIDTITVNGPYALRDDPFFYQITQGESCYSYLQHLETAYANSGDSGLHSGYMKNGNRWFEGTVKSVHGNSMQIIPCADTWEAQSGGDAGITVTLRLQDGSTAPAPQKDGMVRIVYNGMIAESYPPQILHVYSVEILP